MNQKQLTIAISLARDEQGRIIMAERRDDEIEDADKKWEFPGGKIEFGEDPEAAVVRETKEESGLDVRVDYLLPHIFTNVWKTKDGTEYHVIILAFVCTVIGGTLHTDLFPDEIRTLRFMDPTEIMTLPTLGKTEEILDMYLKTKH
jgi:8-oxo-dGTP diphosphatase